MYKSGDMIVVRGDLVAGDSYGEGELDFVPEMLPFRNRTARVIRVLDSYYDWFSLDIDNGRFHWCSEMVFPFMQSRTKLTEDEEKRIFESSSSFFDMLSGGTV